MNTRLLVNVLQSAVLVVSVGMVGLSLSRVQVSIDPTAGFLVGAGIALLAIAIAYPFLPKARSLQEATPPQRLWGLRVMVGGLAVAVVGWLVAVFISLPIGHAVGGIGALSGLVGMLLHWLLWRRNA